VTQIDPGTVLTAAAMAIGVVVWLVRLEGRLNAQGDLYAQLRNDVTYIRDRIDQALNGHK
jgi:hypothetical protein